MGTRRTRFPVAAKMAFATAGAKLPVGKWLRLMIEHEIHHRGQLYMALGILGVATPPIYGLTSEQVRERSVPRDAVPLKTEESPKT